MSETSLVILNGDRKIEQSRFKITPIGLKIDGNPTFDEWSVFGERLQQYDGAIQWAIGDWLNEGESRYGETYTQAIEALNGKYQTLNQYKWVAGHIEFINRLINLSWTHHLQVAKFPPAEQKRWLHKAEKEDWSVSELRAAIKDQSRSEAMDEIVNTVLNSDTAGGIYPLLYVDPPWRYEFVEADNRAIENQYPTMSLDEICDLPIQDVAADDCVLFMWATSPKLYEAMRVLDAWGFVYRTCAVWVKDKIGMGYYFRQRHELLLVATRGNVPVPETDDRFDSVIEAPRLEHSKKPDQVYTMIERMYPEFFERGLLCELFARSRRQGWRSWGNQVL